MYQNIVSTQLISDKKAHTPARFTKKYISQSNSKFDGLKLSARDCYITQKEDS